MKITSSVHPSPKGDITWYEITNAQGASVTLSTMGAGIVKVCVPDKDGKIENVALSYAEAADYIADGPCLGKCPGRFANRIAKGHLVVGDKEYQLAINNGENALHGGPEGFQNQNWDAEVLEDGVKFTYKAKDGEENYPGNITVTATYRWSEDNVLTLDFHAESDADTVVNLTNHAYWNLDGADAGKIFDHKMKIKASKWLPQDRTQIPTGTLAATAGGPMDFRMEKKIGEDIKRDFEALHIGKGYDHCWAFDGWEPGKMIVNAVELEAAKSGRKLVMSTDQPGVQVYTGNWLDGSPKNCSGKSYEDYDGVAIEMQGFPDAPNKPHFPTSLLKAGESYDRKIVFAFK